MLSRKGMQKVLRQLPVYAHVDWVFNLMGKLPVLTLDGAFKVYMVHQALLDEGTKTGVYKSSATEGTNL